MTKLKNKKNRQRILSILLVFALVITGLFAFLSATDTKTNVFTIGNIKAQLWEDFDVDKDGNITDGTNDTPDNVFGPETQTPPTVQNILPGDTILKQPYVKNTGSNEEWVYMIVQVPLEDKDDLIAGANGAIGLTNGATDPVEERVIVTAYAVQDNYNGETTLAGIWGELTATGGPLDASTYFGTASNDSDLVQIFTINGTDTTTWTPLAIGSGTAGAPFKSANGYNYYAYGYNTKLPAKAANESTYPQTSELFQSVTFANAVGETQPVVVNYFGLNSNNNSGSGTGAGSADLSIYTPSIPGYHLVHQEEVMPNTGITLYFEDSLVQSGKTLTWVDSETNEEAYTGMRVSSTTNLLANYNTRASASAQAQDYSWLSFVLNGPSAHRTSATLCNYIDTSSPAYTAWSNSEAGQAGEIVVPSEITITTAANSNTTTANYVIVSTNQATSPVSSISGGWNNTDEAVSYTVPVTDVQVTVVSSITENFGLAAIAKKVTLPDSVTTLSSWSRNVQGRSTVLEDINIPFSCTTLGGQSGTGFAFNSSLEEIYIPNSVTTIGANVFREAGVFNDLIISRSVTTIGTGAFAGSSAARLIILPTSLTVEGTGALFTIDNRTEYLYFNAPIGNRISYNSNNLPANIDIYMGTNVEALPFGNVLRSDNTIFTINYMGTEAEFRALPIRGAPTQYYTTVDDYLSYSNVSTLASVNFNVTDPYAA